MDDRWRLSFNAFLGDVGCAPSKEYTIERINNNGNYEPGNVRWATKKEQAQNKRNSILITYLCRTRLLGEWCQILKLKYGSLHKAIRIVNRHTNPNKVFVEFVMSMLKKKHGFDCSTVNKRVSKIKSSQTKPVKDKRPRYYHDLQSVLIKHGLTDENGVNRPRKTLNFNMK